MIILILTILEIAEIFIFVFWKQTIDLNNNFHESSILESLPFIIPFGDLLFSLLAEDRDGTVLFLFDNALFK